MPYIQPFDNVSYVKVKPPTFRSWPWLDFPLSEHMGHSIQVPPLPKKTRVFCLLAIRSQRHLFDPPTPPRP